MRDWTLRPAKVDKWATRPPRRPYAGVPPRRVLKRVDVTRNDLDGWPVYEISPKLPDGAPLNGHVLFPHGGCYVVDLAPALYWPFLAKLSVLLRRTVTVPIYPLAPEHTYREVCPVLVNVYRRLLDDHDPKSIALMGDSAGATQRRGDPAHRQRGGSLHCFLALQSLRFSSGC